MRALSRIGEKKREKVVRDDGRAAQRLRVERNEFVAGLLRHYYTAVSREEMPSGFAELLARLEEAEKKHRRA